MKNHAFTLIELSIVLVIIGLLAASIMVGKTMMESATLRKAMSDIEATGAAISTYKGKYNALPGDDNTAYEKFAGGSDGVCGGDNPGNYYNDWSPSDLCDGYQDSVIWNREIIRAWHHLQLAGIIDYKLNPSRGDLIDIGITQAASDARGQWPGILIPDFGMKGSGAVMTPLYLTGCRVGLTLAGRTTGGGTYTDDYRYITGITALQTKLIDTKLDDGIPNTGRIWGTGAGWGGCGPFTGAHAPSTYGIDYAGCAMHVCFER